MNEAGVTLIVLGLSLIIFLYINIVLHELGHLIFGLLTGYRFLSFRLFSLVWAKEGDRVVFKKSPNKVMSGQCLMKPPEDESQFKYLLYNLGGGIINLLTGIFFVILGLFSSMEPPFGDVIIGGVTISVFMGLVNLIPLYMGIPNDGLNVLTALKSPYGKRGLYLMLLSNYEVSQGKRYREFDDTVFSLPDEVDCSNYLVFYILSLQAAHLYDQGHYEESIQVYDRVNLDKLVPYYRNSAYADLIYYHALYNPDREAARGAARDFYNRKGMQKYLKMGPPTFTRIAAAYQFFIEGNYAEGRILLEKAKADLPFYPSMGIVLMETDYLKDLEEMMGAIAF